MKTNAIIMQNVWLDYFENEKQVKQRLLMRKKKVYLETHISKTVYPYFNIPQNKQKEKKKKYCIVIWIVNESILFIPKPGLSFMIVIYGAKTKFYINKRDGRLMNDMEKK